MWSISLANWHMTSQQLPLIPSIYLCSCLTKSNDIGRNLQVSKLCPVFVILTLFYTLRKSGSNIRVVFRIILFWSFKGHFWSNLDRFDPFSDQYLQMDQIHQDHFWSDFRIKVLIRISGSLWSGKDELLFDTAFGSKVILFVSYLILAF